MAGVERIEAGRVRSDDLDSVLSIVDVELDRLERHGLASFGLKLLTVQGAGHAGVWEEMATRAGVLSEIRANIVTVAADGADAIRAWNEAPDVDAWITWESWHYRLQDTTDLVAVEEAVRVYLGTPIARLQRTDQRETAEDFLRFLLTNEVRAIFLKWGWSDPPVRG